MKNTESGKEKAARQCWECLKRRLVCDLTLPHCKKCQKAGKECSGYDGQKPLQWVQSGKVNSRRIKDSAPKIYTVPTRVAPNRNLHKPKDIKAVIVTPPPEVCSVEAWSVTSLPESGLSNNSSTYPQRESEFVDRIKHQPFFTSWTSSSEDEWGHLAEDFDDKVTREVAFRNASLSSSVERLFTIGNRAEIEDILAKGSQEDAARMVGAENNPLKRLERVLFIMKSHDVPNYTNLRCETNEVVQSVKYYNERIRPTILVSEDLAPNPAVMHFPMAALNLLPPAVHHTLVCLSLNHYIHSLPFGADKIIAAGNRSKIYHHRGAAIRALSEYVGKDQTQCNDLSISSILVFMSMELQNPPMADWRSHAGGLNRLIEMRGGFEDLLKQSPYLSSTLSMFVLQVHPSMPNVYLSLTSASIVTMANTCSPSWDQLDLGSSPTYIISVMQEMYSQIFPYMLCPPSLFFTMMRVSHLRARIAVSMFAGDMDAMHTLQAHDLLSSIEAFSPEDWAQPGAHYEEWVLVGSIYQAAIALYCTMAFQSLTVFPCTLAMEGMRTVHGDRLLAHLRVAMDMPRLVNFMCWPLTVMGVEAGYRDERDRYWIAKQLGELSRLLGTSGPLKSQAVLRRYWEKEESGWDECFDRSEAILAPWMGG